MPDTNGREDDEAQRGDERSADDRAATCFDRLSMP
jgi:hypothetical protein